MAPQQAIRFSELRSPRGESTQASGTDATNDAGMAPQASHTPARSAEDPQGDAEHTVMEQEGGMVPSGGGGGGGEESRLKAVTLRTAPQDARFPTANQSRRCYVAYNEYYKCITEKGKGSGDCRPYMRAFRSICPDEWIERWEDLRSNDAWYGKY